MGVELHTTEKQREKVILVGIATQGVSMYQAREHLAELGRLAETAGGDVCETIIQRREKLDPSTLIGRGKVREVSEAVKRHQADLVIFDEDLSGSQAKNLETVIPIKIIDRSGIILDIFARHARTAESKIQVEVAQLEYMMPRLTRAWTHLCRQVGGIGTRGPGETQLEVDRRLVRKRIADLNKKLSKIETHRLAQHRNRIPTFHAALVGYTNAGKSTLMNSLTQANVKAENILFATLDPTTRKIFLGPGKTAVLSDTVGFIRKLPHGLVSSFQSTLSVVKQSNLIIHVVDCSGEEFEEHMEVTARVLKELGTDELPRITVFNKIDLLEKERLQVLQEQNPKAVFVSAENKVGLENFKKQLLHFHAEANAFMPNIIINNAANNHSNNDSNNETQGQF